mmetsp:Transcript_34083/g.62726  ORF Transcript_34083/g.62726 Transcript_34083/m.62726 type:complete len:1146 (-) Transcript_34083:212-3649(-)
MSAYNNDDERRGRQRSDGRYAKQRSSGKPDHPKRNVNAAPLASFRSQRYILPENYNPGNGSPSRSSPGVPPPPPPRGDYYPGNGSSKSPGAPPPPPPPPPPYPRVRNSSFHSTSAAGNGLRGRSLSTARIAPSSQLKSRHGEDKDDANAEFTRRGRSLSTARSKPVTPLSPSALPLIDQNGKHRSRSRSKSKSRGGRQPKKKGDDSPTHKSSSRTKMRHSAPSRRTSESDNDVASQKSFEQVIVENSASSYHSRHSSSSRGRSTSRSRDNTNTGTAASPSPSTTDRATTVAKAKEDQSSTSTRKFVLEIGDRGGVVQVFEFSDNGALPANAESSQPKQLPEFIQNILRKYSADEKKNTSSTSTRSSSRGRSTSRSRGTTAQKEHSTRRKIMAESDAQDNIIQEFEFSDNGALHATTARDESPFSKSSRSVSLPRAIREAYDKGKVPHAKQVVPSTRRKDSNSVASPDDFVSRQKSFQSSSSRSASLPRAIREAYEKGKVPQEKQVPSSRGRGSNSGATPGDFVSRQKSSQPSRSASLPRARTGVALRTSLRSSRRGGRSNTVSSASVSFAIDNEGGKASKPSAFDTSETSFGSTESSCGSSDRSISFMTDQQDDRQSGDTRSALTSSSQDNSSAYPQQSRGRALDTKEKSDESSTRRSVSFIWDQGNRERPSLTASSKASSQVRVPAYPQPPPRGKSTLDTSERSNESSTRRSVSFMSDQANRGSPLLTSSMPNSQVHAAYPKQSRGKSTLDTSERSDESSARQSVSFMSDHADRVSPLLTRSMPNRRSVSFMMDQDESQTLRSSAMASSMASSQVRAPAYPQPPPQGRTSYTRSNTGEYLTVFRRPRSLSKSRSTDCPSLVINDNSSLTSGSQDRPISAPPRGRSPAMTSPMASSQGRASAPRQARSLSRTRNAISRDVNFDPAASITNSPQGKYETVTRRNARPFEKILQKSMLSHSTEETFISALANDEESFFSNHTTKAVGELDHLMNSTLTIFESKCDDEDPSLLSDATSLIDQQRPSLAPQENRTQPASTNGVKIHVMKDDYNDTREATNEERRSRIRRMLSRKASSKRRDTLAGSKTLPDTSGRTREILGTDGSSPSVLMESAENSLMHLQQYVRGQEFENRQGSGRQKSRLPRFLHR